MGGGKGKIKPEDGIKTQFSSDNQPEEKWTEEKALQLANDLITWQKTDGSDNIFWEEFLIMERDLYPEIIAYLCGKFSPFLKLIEKAKKIQELKLQKYGIADTLNAPITKFVLINKHGWRDKQELTGADGKELFTKLTDEELEKKIIDLEKKLAK